MLQGDLEHAPPVDAAAGVNPTEHDQVGEPALDRQHRFGPPMMSRHSAVTPSVAAGWSASVALAAACAASKACLASLERASQVAVDARLTLSISSGVASPSRLMIASTGSGRMNMASTCARHRRATRYAAERPTSSSSSPTRGTRITRMMTIRSGQDARAPYNSVDRIRETGVEVDQGSRAR
jgi:septum formation inhibitor MinC